MKKMICLMLVMLAGLVNTAFAQSLGGEGNPNAPQAKAIKVPVGEAGVRQIYGWFEDRAKQYGENITGYDGCMTSSKGEMLMWAVAKTSPGDAQRKAVLDGNTRLLPVEAKIYATLTESADGTITVTPGADERRCQRDKTIYK